MIVQPVRRSSWLRLRAEVRKNGNRRASQEQKAEVKRRTKLAQEAGRHKRGRD